MHSRANRTVTFVHRFCHVSSWVDKKFHTRALCPPLPILLARWGMQVSLFGYFFLGRTPMFDWYVVGWGLKNKHHNNTCLKEIGPWCQILYWLLYTQWWTWLGGSMYLIKESTSLHGSFNFNMGFFWVVDLLMQHQFCCANIIGESWRTWKTYRKTYMHVFSCS